MEGRRGPRPHDHQSSESGTAEDPPPVTDDFGLPIRQYPDPKPNATADQSSNDSDGDEKFADAVESTADDVAPSNKEASTPNTPVPSDTHAVQTADKKDPGGLDSPSASETAKPSEPLTESTNNIATPDNTDAKTPTAEAHPASPPVESTADAPQHGSDAQEKTAATAIPEEHKDAPAASNSPGRPGQGGHRKNMESIASVASGPSEFSHQRVPVEPTPENEDDDGGWQEMPAFARYDMYNDDNKLIARERNDDEDEETVAYAGLGGAGKGYTRVQMDEDAQSANSMDDNTQYLFKEGAKGTAMPVENGEDDEDARDAMSQMQATKDLLTEGQRIAYVGIVRLEIATMITEGEQLESTRKIKKEVATAVEALRMWGQKMMIRLYTHMDISEAEQVMIEQLADHGVVPQDLVPALHANARVRNPMAGHDEVSEAPSSPAPDSKSVGRPSTTSQPDSGERASASVEGDEKMDKATSENDEKNAGEKAKEKMAENKPQEAGEDEEEEVAEPPPPYEAHTGDDAVPDVQTPSQMPSTEKIDIDLRWTVLCDLFLILIADSVYDARSRVLLERVGKSLDVSWIDICRFEKRVTDALEMQQAAEKENWNEDEHMENRRKRALKKRYMMMGLATVGGGLVIGLSAGLLAPVIGAGLAAGFSTIGVAGTSGFLGGVGGAAIITSGGVASGGIVGVRAANRRTGAVKTFEYRPLHNNKRVNLIVSVSGWLTGKMDDVRLPFSTVDPTMGDIYSVLWEPEMLRSMGDTIRILATEALTQSIQQILGSTILAALMGALQLPIILTKLSYLIDNPWTVSLDRATAAGKILADSLIERNLGTRPITLVGYSLGSRVIFSALQELAKRGAYGLIQNVYLFGSPVVVKKEEYLRARTVVAGRFVNGFNRTDWILGYLFRLTNGGIRRVAGLAAIDDMPWIENVDVTDLVPGHMEYRTAMPMLLMRCGWSVESEVFTEIEDPDPDNHDERQRELINEIEEARRELEKEGKNSKGGRFSLFGRRKKADRQDWELYEEEPKGASARELDDKGRDAAYQGALFDVDAIRAELAKDAAKDGTEKDAEEFQVREIKSTLPPMKLDLSAASSPSPSDGRPSFSPATRMDHSPLRGTRSADQVPTSTYGGGDGDDGISMTFDTAFANDPHKPSDDPPSTRPGLKSSQTMPVESNPWGDPDDDDFGKEKEISMTFA